MAEESSSKTLHAIHNLYWMLIQLMVITIFPFIIRSLMIRKWGIEYAGVSGLCSSILQVLNVSELGMGSALLYSMYKPMAEHNTQEINALLNLYRKIYRTLGIVVFLAGMMLLPFLRFLVKGECPSDVNLYIVYCIQILNATIGYAVSYYWVVLLQADQKLEMDYIISAIFMGGMYVFQLIIIYHWRNYYLYMILFPIATMAVNLVRAAYVRHQYPSMHCEGTVSHLFVMDFRKRVFAMAISKIRTTVRSSIDSIVISANMGLIVLAQYQNYYQMMMIPVLLVNVLRGAVLPGFGVSVATEGKERNYLLFELYSFANNWISVWCGACLLCLGQNFMCLWVGVENMLPDSALILFCIYYYLRSMGDNATLIRETTGTWWIGKEGAVIETVLNLILNIIVVKYWGIQGVLAATIITLLFVNIPVEYVSVFRGYFQVDIGCYARKQFVYFVNGCVVIGITYMICRQFPIGNFRALIAEAGICILVPNLLYAALNYHRKEFKQILSMLLDVCRHKI